MNIFYRSLLFFDPEVRKLHSENRALARSLKVKIDSDNHPIVESKRLHSLDFNRTRQLYLPSRPPVTFNLQGLKICRDTHIN
jgi:hypothetical protein